MKCKHVQQQLLDYSESLVDSKSHSLIEEHLSSCSTCARELQEFEQTIHLLQSVPFQEPPDADAFWSDFTSNVMRNIRKTERIPEHRRLFIFPHSRMVFVAIAVFFMTFGSLMFYFTGGVHRIFSFMFPSSKPIIAERSESKTVAEVIEMKLEEIASEELVNDILDTELALIDKDNVATFDVDNSDEALYRLIESLNDKEKELLLLELRKMR